VPEFGRYFRENVSRGQERRGIKRIVEEREK